MKYVYYFSERNVFGPIEGTREECIEKLKLIFGDEFSEPCLFLLHEEVRVSSLGWFIGNNEEV